MNNDQKLWEITAEGAITEQSLRYLEFLSRAGGSSTLNGQPVFHRGVDRQRKTVTLADLNNVEITLKYKHIIKGEDEKENDPPSLRYRALLKANVQAFTEQCRQSETMMLAHTRCAHKLQWMVQEEARNFEKFLGYAARTGIEISCLPDGRIFNCATLEVLGTTAVELPKVVIGSRITSAEAATAGITTAQPAPAQPIHSEEEILIAMAKAFEREERRLKAAGLPVPESMEFEYDPRNQIQ